MIYEFCMFDVGVWENGYLQDNGTRMCVGINDTNLSLNYTGKISLTCNTTC